MNKIFSIESKSLPWGGDFLTDNGYSHLLCRNFVVSRFPLTRGAQAIRIRVSAKPFRYSKAVRLVQIPCYDARWQPVDCKSRSFGNTYMIYSAMLDKLKKFGLLPAKLHVGAKSSSRIVHVHVTKISELP